MPDSRISTYEHIHQVQTLLMWFITHLQQRLLDHDKSKLFPPELAYFDIYTDKLSDSTYGSDEYKNFLREMKPGLDHHYANNSHHPEYYSNGILGMNLVDLLEMLVDWKAATLRHKDGDLVKSIHLNQKRFGYSDELKSILLNTVELLPKS